MRRFVFSIAAAGMAALLTACGGGGSALGFAKNPSPTSVIVTVAAPSNIARVLPGAGLALSAVAVSGSSNGIVSGNSFRWSAMLTTGLQYPFDAFGTMRPCASVNLTSGGVTQPYTADFSIFVAIDPTNEGNIILEPPPAILPPNKTSTIQTNYPYCVVVSATPTKIDAGGMSSTPIGPPGSIVVEVVDPQNPLQ